MKATLPFGIARLPVLDNCIAELLIINSVGSYRSRGDRERNVFLFGVTTAAAGIIRP